jgi:hypothetical protein
MASRVNDDSDGGKSSLAFNCGRRHPQLLPARARARSSHAGVLADRVRADEGTAWALPPACACARARHRRRAGRLCRLAGRPGLRGSARGRDAAPRRAGHGARRRKVQRRCRRRAPTGRTGWVLGRGVAARPALSRARARGAARSAGGGRARASTGRRAGSGCNLSLRVPPGRIPSGPFSTRRAGRLWRPTWRTASIVRVGGTSSSSRRRTSTAPTSSRAKSRKPASCSTDCSAWKGRGGPSRTRRSTSTSSRRCCEWRAQSSRSRRSWVQARICW